MSFFSSELVQLHEDAISAMQKFSVLSNSIDTCGRHFTQLPSGIARESLQINDGTAAERKVAYLSVKV